MPDIQNFDQQTKAYFDTLPKMVQESIVQSGVDLHSKEELMKVASHLTQNTKKVKTEAFPNTIPNLK